MNSKRHALLALLLGLTSSAVTAQTLRSQRIATGFVQPTYLTAPPNDPTRLFVVEQGGRIRLIKNGVVLATPFLDITTSVLSGGERGLLGLAFHPAYATNRRFYVYFTRRPDGAIVVNRYLRSLNNPDRASAETGQTVIVIPHPNFSNHNGGCLQFGPDGFLYFGTGDGGSGGDPNCNAQNGASLLGKLLRIDVDSGSPYVVPPSNPFVGVPGFQPEIWAVGLRNPWRFSFDALTGDLYLGDVGQDTQEEIDFTPAGTGGGENYGWKIMEGTTCFSSASCTNPPPCNSPLFTDPIWTYNHAGTNNCSVTGGYVYRGSRIAGLGGTYFFADFCSSQIWSFRVVGGVVQNFTNRTAELDPPNATINSITSFGEDATGELYIVDQGGEIFRIMRSEGDASWKVVNEHGELIEDGQR